MRIDVGVLVLALGALPMGAFATEATVLYTFSGTDGETVTTVGNLGTAGSTYDGTASVASGASVTYSDDVPAKYLCSDVNAVEPLSTDWKSVCFSTNAAGQGAIIRALDLGKHLSEAATNTGFTIEFFMKFEKAQSWKNFSKFWYKSASSGNQQAKYVLWGSGVGLQMNGSNPTTTTLSSGVWYHLAAVYTPADGNWRMYCNGACYATQNGEVKGAASTTRLDLGGDGTTSENFAGKMAAFRVTPTALTTDKFLRARKTMSGATKEGVLGFWSFTDGQPGDPAKICEKDTGDPFDVLTGTALGSGPAPVFSDDVPGPVVFESVTNLTPIATGAQSVRFAGNSGNNSGGCLTFLSLCKRLSEAGAFTIEFFAKLEADYTWRNFFAMTLNSSQTMKLADRALTQLATQIGAENSAELGFTMKNAWHHYALTWDAESKDFCTYVDHVKVKTVANISLSGSASGYFGCQNNGVAGELMNGKLFGLRISTKRLDPLDMLAAGPEPVPEHAAKTVFHWDFEDPGAADGVPISQAGARPVNAGFYNALPQHSYSQVPSYACEVSRPNRPYTMQGQEIVTTNGYSARFWGWSATYDAQWAGSRLENGRESSTSTLCYNPTNFTFELFLKRDTSEGVHHDGPNGELLATFGNSGCDGSNRDWYLFFANKAAYSTCELIGYAYDENGKEYKIEPKLGFLDGQWHHLALTYDNDTRTMVLYLDRQEIGRLVLAAPLRRTSGYRYGLGRGQNTSGFNGWLDDVRLTDGVLEPSQFLRKGYGPRGVVLIVR